LDPTFVRHILGNLTSNAIKYSPENSQINIQTKAENGTIIFSVKDEGIGISDEDQKRLFEKFFRASNATGIQGTGLGLHIMKNYVDKLNGTIKMKSQLGKGTEVTVEIKHQVMQDI
jgi:signal transduction histidine kinase